MKKFPKDFLVAGVKDGIISVFSWGMVAGVVYYTYYLIVKKSYLGIQYGDMMILIMSMMLGTMVIYKALALIEEFERKKKYLQEYLLLLRKIQKQIDIKVHTKLMEMIILKEKLSSIMSHYQNR